MSNTLQITWRTRTDYRADFDAAMVRAWVQAGPATADRARWALALLDDLEAGALTEADDRAALNEILTEAIEAELAGHEIQLNRDEPTGDAEITGLTVIKPALVSDPAGPPVIGIPYAWTDPGTGERVCPACSKRIAEQYDADGEALTVNYAAHYEAEHAWQAGMTAGEQRALAFDRTRTHSLPAPAGASANYAAGWRVGFANVRNLLVNSDRPDDPASVAQATWMRAQITARQITAAAAAAATPERTEKP